MNMYEVILCVIGVFFVIGSFLMNTKNVKSAIVFKAIPFLCGVYCIFFAVYSSGLISIN